METSTLDLYPEGLAKSSSDCIPLKTYSKKNQVAEWQADMNYCTDKVKVKRQYAHGRKLLDLVDLHVLDYLIGR
ncbi:hypothetical protein TELCIR_23958 [Teladorsagia circumcincta]|uniref:FAM20 C-terminal domain-containing protein n=1 Tax=Teladorsagia circumcincta TaxID=45464 RepID=A0A2G9TAV3_TELCI|nr:hypothetical protein TELCIR_23958 [Teladorsagia circumcincta]